MKFAVPLAVLLALLVSIPSASACFERQIDFNPGSMENTLSLGGNGADIIAINGSSFTSLDGDEEIWDIDLWLVNRNDVADFLSDNNVGYALDFEEHSTKFRDVAINPCPCLPNEKTKKDGKLDIILQLKDLDLKVGNELPAGQYMIYIEFRIKDLAYEEKTFFGSDCVKLVPPDK